MIEDQETEEVLKTFGGGVLKHILREKEGGKGFSHKRCFQRPSEVRNLNTFQREGSGLELGTPFLDMLIFRHLS